MWAIRSTVSGLPEPDDPLERHPGSLDVDLALDHRTLTEAGYETIDGLHAAVAQAPPLA